MKILKVENGLKFDNGFTIEDYHEQDCCESVYADFSYLLEANVIPHTGESITIYDIEFDDDIENNIELEEGMGFKLVAKDGSKWFVPCYNEQNGYYSTHLELIITKGKIKIIMDITECSKDDIC